MRKENVATATQSFFTSLSDSNMYLKRHLDCETGTITK